MANKIAGNLTHPAQHLLQPLPATLIRSCDDILCANLWPWLFGMESTSLLVSQLKSAKSEMKRKHFSTDSV